MSAEDARRARSARMAAYARAASLSPERRSEIASLAARAGIEKRRQAREDAGLPAPKTKDYNQRQNPPLDEMQTWLDEVAETHPEWGYEARLREALVRRRAWLARAEYDAGNKK